MITIDEITFLGIPPYSFWAAIAGFSGFVFLVKIFRKESRIYTVLPQVVSIIGISIIGGGVLTGYLIEVAKNISELGVKAFFTVEQCGFVAYGGIIGALTAGMIYSSIKKIDKNKFMDGLSCVIPFSHAIARIGCLFSGCCYGKEYNGFLSVKYWNHEICRFPWQLSEMALNFILACIIYKLMMSEKCKGKCVYVYLYSYAAYRFVLEFWRGDEYRGLWGGFSTSQYISMGVIITVSVIICYQRKNKVCT